MWLALWRKCRDEGSEVSAVWVDSVGRADSAVKIELPYLKTTVHDFVLPIQPLRIVTRISTDIFDVSNSSALLGRM